VARVQSARMVSPARAAVDMPIEGGYVGMVDRETFDEWLRERAQSAGAQWIRGTFEKLTRDPEGAAVVHYKTPAAGAAPGAAASIQQIRALAVIGADGARSAVARQCIPGAHRMRFVAAYHEIVRAPTAASDKYLGTRCDVYYQGALSPDFYSWIFPHGDTASIGVGSAKKGFSLRAAVSDLRSLSELGEVQTLRREGAPIPMKPLRRWDDGRDVVLAGDAAGVVAPA
jgi:geranylgeranyl diphosphate/geranylgeranyl-bacteriochlorophyllide a reductase